MWLVGVRVVIISMLWGEGEVDAAATVDQHGVIVDFGSSEK
jgi:hypothetical protein